MARLKQNIDKKFSIFTICILLSCLHVEQVGASISEVDESTTNVQVCDPALAGEDCVAYPFEICSSEEKICVHKSVFPAEN